MCLIVEGMMLSFAGTGAGIHKPKNDEEKTGLIVFLVGKKAMEMDKKMFILSIGAFTAFLGVILFTLFGEF